MIAEWTTESSRVVLDDTWLHVRADRCRRDDGLIVEPYYVIGAGAWVSIVPLTHDGEVITIDEYHHGAGIVGLGLPGGGAEPGEAPAVAAERELLEETGYRASRLLSLGSAYANWGNQDNQVHYFVAFDCEPVGDQSLDATEEIEVHFESIENVCAPGFLKQSFHVANMFLALPHLSKSG